MSGALDVSKVSRYDDNSILREFIVLEAADNQSRYRKFENQLRIWAADGEIENAMACMDIMNALDRPWEAVPEQNKRKTKYTAEDLVEMYQHKFPGALKKEQ